MTLLEIDALSLEFATPYGRMRVLDDVTIGLDDGEILGLVGESGCGKTCTALATLGLLPPTCRVVGGTIRFRGQDLLSLTARELRRIRSNEIGMIFQDPMTSLDPIMRVGGQLVETIVRNTSMTRRQARGRALELLELVGIPRSTEVVKQYPYQLSGGMQQRIMISMALSCRPSIILADEPTTALDVTVQAQVLEVLRRAVTETGTSLLLISHDLGVVAGMTQRVCVMYSGQVVEEASTMDLFSDPRSPYTRSLLAAVPRVDEPVTDRRLAVIEGQPPSGADETVGCRFSPRCPERREVCCESPPKMTALGPSHSARCFGAEPGGWIRSQRREELATRNPRPVPRESDRS